MKIAFVCIQNSCRSQIAEAFGKKYFKKSVECYSAGSNPADWINPMAVKIMKERYNIDMTCDQYPKGLSKLPKIDILVTMGCGIQCPYITCQQKIEWNIEDPADQEQQTFTKIVDQIKSNVLALKRQI